MLEVRDSSACCRPTLFDSRADAQDTCARRTNDITTPTPTLLVGDGFAEPIT